MTRTDLSDTSAWLPLDGLALGLRPRTPNTGTGWCRVDAGLDGVTPLRRLAAGWGREFVLMLVMTVPVVLGGGRGAALLSIAVLTVVAMVTSALGRGKPWLPTHLADMGLMVGLSVAMLFTTTTSSEPIAPTTTVAAPAVIGMPNMIGMHGTAVPLGFVETSLAISAVALWLTIRVSRLRAARSPADRTEQLFSALLCLACVLAMLLGA